MINQDRELHEAKRELDALVARMRLTDHARAFLGYADAVVFAALRDLPRHEHEAPRVHSLDSLRERASATR
ncbi:MAG: hypothetical protein ACLGHG_05500 [Gammaproteobacteria bacterium]